MFPYFRRYFAYGHIQVLLALLVLASANFAGPSPAAPGPGECPQPRFTGKAPVEYLERKNPFVGTAADLAAAGRIYSGESDQVNCAICHGKKDDGKGLLASQYDPPPRNFACAKTIDGVPDGQLFWIIRNGSPRTGMPPHTQLADENIWRLVLYVRSLAR